MYSKIFNHSQLPSSLNLGMLQDGEMKNVLNMLQHMNRMNMVP
jgi:hypothetical protein